MVKRFNLDSSNKVTYSSWILIEINGEGLTIPERMRFFMVFIDRVGFPVLAFLLMFGLAVYTLKEIVPTLQRNTEALISMQGLLQSFKEEIQAQRMRRGA